MSKKYVKYYKKDNNYFKNFFLKSLICLLLFLLFLIGNKKEKNFSDLIYQNIYSKNITFAKINSWYKKHFGNLLPVNDTDEVLVFNNYLTYIDQEEYYDGVMLKVEDNYLVPSIASGIVVYIGEKDKYGKTIIIEDENGIDMWYSNINIGNINMYDFIDKGDILGEAIEGKIILLFQKNGEFEDYKKYI